jgi:POT family proton-dependent oligopeptide transporter
MKSFIMALFLGSISMGNFLTFLVTKANEGPGGLPRLTPQNFYLFFTGMMTLAAVVFVFVARNFQVKTFIQDEAPAELV